MSDLEKQGSITKTDMQIHKWSKSPVRGPQSGVVAEIVKFMVQSLNTIHWHLEQFSNPNCFSS